MRTTSFLVVLSLSAALAAQQQPTSFVNFESPQTHPLAISPDGSRLYAVNTPDNRLAVFSLRQPDRPLLLKEIAVGLEPVSVTPHTADEVWVTNRLSDSVSVVSVAQGRVVATLRVKDEPADVAFAGSPEVALVSVSGSKEVRVFDPASYTELAAIPIFGEEPRALAVSADGTTAWIAVHRSGNKTTVVPADQAPPPPPPQNPNLPAAPQQSLIVDADDPQWTSAHGLTLPDYDVFEIDVASRQVARRYSGVGTSLYNIAVQPTTGDLWVANSEALNLVRFVTGLRGHVADHRLTRITPGAAGTMVIYDLNPQIDYGKLPNNAALSTALAQPTDVAFSPDGATLYVAAFGSDRVAAVDGTGQVKGFAELGTAGAATDPRSMRGPRGLAVHPTASRLYVLNRLAMSLAVIDTASLSVVREMPLGFDPTPAAIATGRGFLYDTKLSGNGTLSCATCHIDGEIDGLAWDLGDPTGDLIQVTGPGGLGLTMHPMKGPMTTQTLRGLTAGIEPLHWRGDKANLQEFNEAFDSLMGGSELPTQDMDDYAAFLHTLAFPPNPNQNLDRSYPTTPAGISAADGAFFFSNTPFASSPFTGPLTCSVCHALPNGTNSTIIPGLILQEAQDFKIPQLRNIYKRQGRVPQNGLSMSGYSLLHDGSDDDVFDLLSNPVFQNLSRQSANKRMLENFVTALDTGMAPTVGYQVTADAQSVDAAAVQEGLALLQQESLRGNCDLVAKGAFHGAPHGFYFLTSSSAFMADSATLATFTRAQLEQEIRTGDAALTFMGVPVGSGVRIGVDRDTDGVLDADEGLRSFGQASPACALAMHLSGNIAPAVGNAGFALVVDGAPASSSGVALLGPNQTSLPFFDLTVLVDPTGSFSLPLQSDAGGLGFGAMPIPATAGLAGSTFYAQAAFPAACGQLGVAVSDGLVITIGS